MRVTGVFLLAAALGACNEREASRRAAPSEVRYVPDGDLSILDPYVSTSSVTMSHAYLVYDTLFALDGRGTPRPQMVRSAESSNDQRTWRFSLRPGLLFHDGRPVTSRDAVASIERWLQVSLYRTFIAPHLTSVRAVGRDGFEMEFARPMPNLLEALAEPTRPIFVMRAADARLSAKMPVRSAIGSGPFIMEMDGWLRGSKVKYRRNASYVAREEPPDHYSGGKKVYVERVTWEIIKDPNTALQALSNGEVDIIEAPHADLLPLIANDPAVKTKIINRLGHQIVARPNHLAPPMNNPKIRRVLLYAVDQRAYLAATGVPVSDRRVCWRILTCQGPYGSDAGLGSWTQASDHRAIARSLLDKSGYRGEPIVILNPVDMPALSAAAMITAQALREVGFTVDLQAVDGNSFFARRAIRAAPKVNRGGWHIFHSVNSGSNVSSAILNPGVPSACDGEGWFGWPCDPMLNTLRARFFFAQSETERRAAADELQTRFYRSVPYVPLGEYSGSIAFRSTIVGLAPAPRAVFWGLKKVEHQAVSWSIR